MSTNEPVDTPPVIRDDFHRTEPKVDLAAWGLAPDGRETGIEEDLVDGEFVADSFRREEGSPPS